MECGIALLINLIITWKTAKSKDDAQLELHINQQLRSKVEEELKKFNLKIEKSHEPLNLPSEVISIIMKMLPSTGRDDENWNVFKSEYAKSNNTFVNIMLAITSIYPITRFAVNLVNFIIIINQFKVWCNLNENRSDWDKYCAFIIASLYMPNLKGWY